MMTGTFSIVAMDRETGEIGIAVASKVLAVGAVVPWARSAVGGVATQSWTNATFGPEGLRLLADGLSAEQALAGMVEADEQRERRQVGIVDAQGRTATWTGKRCTTWAGQRAGEGFTAQGNLLAGPAVIEAMARAFETSSGPLPERLMAALEAGQSQGGDRRGQQSAALLVVKDKGGPLGLNDRYVDLRVDDSERPTVDLRRLLEIHRKVRLPQALIDEFVIASHADLNKVTTLAERHPMLVHARARWDETPLEAASHVGQKAIVEFLLAQGASMDVYAAAVLGKKDRVAAFLQDDPTLARVAGVHGIPALFFPAIAGQAEVAELLLRAGADVNAGAGGTTALHGAARAGLTDMAAWLLEHGADPTARDFKGKTPLRVAADAGHGAVAELLRQRGGTE
jgi:uncharacterized Ntn-hydrolase superfamily protein